MNGRCENDALDAAVDVCDACGGEFCFGCLLFPNGPKKVPLCTACAIGTSGVRKAAKRERLQSRGSASKRRKELRKLAAAEQTQSLVVLDDLPDIGFDHEIEPEPEQKPKKKRLRRKGDRGDKSVAEPELDHDGDSFDDGSVYEEQGFVPFEFEADTETLGSDLASKMLEEIKSAGEVEQIDAESADVWNLPEDFATDAEIEPQPSGQSETQDLKEAVFEPEAEYLPEPESAAQSDPGPGFASAPGADDAPAWEALHNPDASNPFDDPSVGRGATTGSGYEDSAIEEAPEVERRVNRVPSPQHRSPSADATQQWHDSPAIADSHPTTEAAPPAPVASAPAPGPASASAPAPLVQPAPPEPKRKKMRDLLHGKPTPPVAVVQPEEVVQERVQDPTTDTDAAGKWIPPNLRGMVAAEQQTELPKRSRRDS